MSQFYAKAEDEERCLHSSITRQPVMVTGLTNEGQLRPFSGTVQAAFGIGLGPGVLSRCGNHSPA
jgi:hypothetical protein